MTGTNSRIPRTHPPVGYQIEAAGVALCDDDHSTTAQRPVMPTTNVALLDPPAQAIRMPRHFSNALVAHMEAALRSGELTLPELRFALQSAKLRNEDDIRQVCEQTIRLKQAIIALGHDAQTLMKRVHPHTVAFLLRSWSIDQNDGAIAAVVP